MHIITYIGMDKSDNKEEYETLEEAKKAVTFIEERGGHSISTEEEEVSNG